jgi:succinylarginine dihydrolase
VEVADAEVPLADAISSYLFNAQLVTPPDGQMTLVVPSEARDTPTVWNWLQRHLAGNGPIRRVDVVDVRQSMANGGGPACLRLRVVADPSTIDERFLVDERRLDLLSDVVEKFWPESIAVADLRNTQLLAEIERARTAVLEALKMVELSG